MRQTLGGVLTTKRSINLAAKNWQTDHPRHGAE